ncbi:putative lipid II flippase FtsW [Fictibacillus sp. b24]|uniref:putative lipid II flippase FtsW n=1 Tax=unclassified Fictibacillus TaxID=2644029 RepID=UPI0025A07438|nr:putative lipid II flippase FtsW [Fictibacillus sp. b24]MDM5316681.1 putative lipid II flippase FtsW [Fictibacillus sp. b24]
MNNVKKAVRPYDYSLIVAVLLLCSAGLVMIYSASIGVTINKYDYSSSFFFTRQLIFLLAGLGLMYFTMRFNVQIYKKMMMPIVLVSILVLVAVLLFGREVNNAKSWLYIGPIGIQPAEFIKLTLAIYLAAIYSKKQGKMQDFKKGVIPPLTIFAIMFLLILRQPDLGTGIIVSGVAGIILFCSGIKFKHIFSMVALAGIAGLGIFLRLSDEQLSRFDAAYAPFKDPAGDGYQLVNGYISIAAGGMTGSGLGESVQKYGFLPEPHTDFIIAIIAEELGFIGVFLIILLLGYIVLKGFWIGMQSNDTYTSLLAFGISGMIGIQTVVNLGAAVGLLPITGVPLPFISYGGSSLLLFLTSMGILINISAKVNLNKKVPDRQPEVNKKIRAIM